jgi:hypothetical protein
MHNRHRVVKRAFDLDPSAVHPGGEHLSDNEGRSRRLLVIYEYKYIVRKRFRRSGTAPAKSRLQTDQETKNETAAGWQDQQLDGGRGLAGDRNDGENEAAGFGRATGLGTEARDSRLDRPPGAARFWKSRFLQGCANFSLL